MNLLQQIITWKREEVSARKIMVEAEELKDSAYFHREVLSLKGALNHEGATGIIAEFKRKSPSKGYINKEADAALITRSYTDHGASALSVLTDHHFFGGSTEDLIRARENNIPILRKEFIVDPYQVLASKAMGADAILLIAACLDKQEVGDLAGHAHELGLEVLLELHDDSELDHVGKDIDLIGINNRNLATFRVDTKRSMQLAAALPPGSVKVAESGIDDPAMVHQFRAAGFKGFLIGEAFMKTTDPGLALKQFINHLKHKNEH